MGEYPNNTTVRSKIDKLLERMEELASELDSILDELDSIQRRLNHAIINIWKSTLYWDEETLVDSDSGSMHSAYWSVETIIDSDTESIRSDWSEETLVEGILEG